MHDRAFRPRSVHIHVLRPVMLDPALLARSWGQPSSVFVAKTRSRAAVWTPTTSMAGVAVLFADNGCRAASTPVRNRVMRGPAVLVRYVCRPGATVARKRRIFYAASEIKRGTAAYSIQPRMAHRPLSAGWVSSNAQIHASGLLTAGNTSVPNLAIDKMHNRLIAHVLRMLCHTVRVGRRLCARYRRPSGLPAKTLYRTAPNLAARDSAAGMHAKSVVTKGSAHPVYRPCR